MPIYLGAEVSDDYLQALIKAYRAGYDGVAGEGASEDADQPIIDTLAEHKVLTPDAARALGEATAKTDEEAGS